MTEGATLRMSRLGFAPVPSGKRARQQREAAAPTAPMRMKSSDGVTMSRNTLLIVAAVVIVAAVGIGLAIGLSGGGGGNSDTSPVVWSKLTGLQNGPPPWNSNAANLQTNLPYLGVQADAMEHFVVHHHEHLDVYVDGKHITVPSQIGIFGVQFFAELHTHDTSGIIHVEAPDTSPLRLGQFFGEWGVLLSSNCLGKYCGHLHWWVNGEPQTGDPANLVLAQHQEIVIAAGTPPATIPSTFDFAVYGV